MVNIADVGLGVSQVLPILVALIQAEWTKQLVYVEQPETHLHPLAQRQIARMIVRAASRGVRVVVETHSSLFLLGLQTAVAEGLLDPGDLALYWFDQDSHGATQAAKAQLDGMGHFSDWPADFDDVVMSADEDYLKAIAKKAYGQN
jgi:predicted ATPase